MVNRHSLSTKVLCLVAFPLLIQLALFSWLAIMLRNAEAELAASTRARAIAEIINVLSKDIFSGIASFTSETTVQEIAKNSDNFISLTDKVRSDYERLRDLSLSNPQLLQTITRSHAGAEAALQTMLALCRNTQKYGVGARDLNNPLWTQLHGQLLQIDYKELVQAGKEQRKIANRETEIQAKFRHQILFLLVAGSAVTIILGVVLALYLTREITGKLEQLTDNAYRLASDLPLNPEMTGPDDISALDRLFHSMGREIKESIRKEKAVVHNVHDMICTVDDDGRITAVNPAVTNLFGYATRDVMGQHLISILVPKDVDKVRSLFSGLKGQAQVTPLEVQLKKADDSVADILLSATWSAQEKKVYAVVHDMTERRQSERLKQEVVAMVTHDLRTPLFTIQNILGFLAEDITDKVEQRLVDYVTMAESNTERMLRLINDLIDSEKMSAEMMQPQLERVELASSFQKCREVAAAIAEDVGIELDFNQTDLVVIADDQMLERVLFNLVVNAIKFSPKGSLVTLSASGVDGNAHVIIEDNGPGIPENELRGIFERFRQGSSRSSKLYASSGLGLSICKAFVELQGGKIWASSEVGKGSQFHFTVPLTAASKS
jgi:PAS domain S-box-containing protein